MSRPGPSPAPGPGPRPARFVLVLCALVLCALALPIAAVMAGLAPGASTLLTVAASPPPFDILGTGGAPARSGTSAPPAAPSAPAPFSAAGGRGGGPGKFLLPMGDIRFSGERSSRGWSVFLTADEAAGARTLQIAYVNAVSVMPEASRISVLVNDRVVLSAPIASAGALRKVEAAIPAGLLRAGANTVAFEVEQRHRVVCTVEGTYELWTDVSAAQTGLTFDAGTQPALLHSLDDIAATGFDEHGRTLLSVVVPRPLDTATDARVLYLAQALAVRGRFIHPVVAVPDRLPRRSRAGELVVILAPVADLPEGVAAPAAGRGPTVDFIGLPDGSPALLVSGPTPADLDRAIASIVPAALRDAQGQPAIDTAAFHNPETPFIRDGGDLTLAALGVTSQEFSGRSLTAGMTVGLPADFYAEAYGEARLVIDAGFAVDLEPGSYLSVSVNGHTASVQPLDVRAGDLLTRLPIRVPMRHFTPGVNAVELAVVLRTAEDAACAPGATLSREPRFALFDTSRLEIPRFARIGTSPDLAAFGARGFPHWHVSDTLNVHLSDRDSGTLAAAATLLARVAFGAQRALPVEIAPHVNALQQRDALLIGASDTLPPAAFSQAGLARDLRSFWAEADLDASAQEAGQPQRPDSQELRERWEQRRRSGGNDGGSSFGEWFSRTFDLTVDAILPRVREVAYSPPNGTLLVLAQGHSPVGNRVWTVVTAGSPAALEHAVGELTRPEPWSRIEGRISAFRQASHAVDTVMPGWIGFIPTQEPSLSNLRMVAANWLSGNLALYALGMLAGCILLGFVTYAFLLQLGRR